MPHVDYKYLVTLPEDYEHKKVSGERVVIAVQKSIQKEEYQIGLKNLVDFFKDRKLISKPLAKEILSINDLRNTFHFTKPREKIVCDVGQVERAFKLLVHVLQQVSKDLLKKPN